MKIIDEDEDDDSGPWELLIDFTKIRKGGIPVEELLKLLEEYDKK